MITCLGDILDREFMTIDVYDGLCKAKRIMDEKRLEYLVAMKNGNLAGVLTSRDICKSHPNRIVADAMSRGTVTASPEMPIWDAKYLFERHAINELLIVEQGELIGVITDTKLYSELGKHIDQLTGLYKSDYIYYKGIKLLKNGNEISILFIDLDKFGQIDKDFGHVLGDRILKEISKVIEGNITADDHICRFGGDEFVILAPCRLEKSVIFAEALLGAISNHNSSIGLPITASIGIAGGRRHNTRACDYNEMVSNLINLASLASTKAKNEKRKFAVSTGFAE